MSILAPLEYTIELDPYVGWPVTTLSPLFSLLIIGWELVVLFWIEKFTTQKLSVKYFFDNYDLKNPNWSAFKADIKRPVTSWTPRSQVATDVSLSHSRALTLKILTQYKFLNAYRSRIDEQKIFDDFFTTLKPNSLES